MGAVPRAFELHREALPQPQTSEERAARHGQAPRRRDGEKAAAALRASACLGASSRAGAATSLLFSCLVNN